MVSCSKAGLSGQKDRGEQSCALRGVWKWSGERAPYMARPSDLLQLGPPSNGTLGCAYLCTGHRCPQVPCPSTSQESCVHVDNDYLAQSGESLLARLTKSSGRGLGGQTSWHFVEAGVFLSRLLRTPATTGKNRSKWSQGSGHRSKGASGAWQEEQKWNRSHPLLPQAHTVLSTSGLPWRMLPDAHSQAFNEGISMRGKKETKLAVGPRLIRPEGTLGQIFF